MSNIWLRKTFRQLYGDRVLAILLVIHSSLLAFAAFSKSPANHEVAQLPAGLIHWNFQKFEVGAVNPPLVRLIGSLPVSFMNPAIAWKRVYLRTDFHSEYTAARDFMSLNGQSAIRFFFVGRLTCIPLSLIGAYVCYRWAREMFDQNAGRFAASLWCFSPSILGEGSLMTSDIPSAAFGLLATYCFCKYLSQGSLKNAAFLGIASGLAISAKFTWLAVMPIVVLPAIVHLLVYQKDIRLRILILGQLGCSMLFALVVVNSAYFFVDTPTRLGDVDFVCKAFTRPETDPHLPSQARVNRFRDTIFADVIVPLPRAFLVGLDVQKRDFELKFPSYLMGEWKHGGWLHYYVIAICVKSPVAFLLLMAIGYCVTWKSAWFQYDKLIVLLLPIIILVFVSLQTGINSHIRYIFPVLPFGFVLASSVMTLGPYWRKLALGLLVWQIASVIWYAPHWSSYFNEMAGGPANGPKWLLHSNVDTGQDLLYLKRWQQKTLGEEPLYFASNSFYDPSDIGLKFDAPPPFVAGRPDITNEKGLRGPQAGWHAVSVAHCFGQNIPTFDGRGGRSESDGHYTYYQRFRPIDRCGYSINLYFISAEQAKQVQQQLTDLEDDSKNGSNSVERLGATPAKNVQTFSDVPEKDQP